MVSGIFPGVPRTSLASSKAAKAVSKGEGCRICPGYESLGSGAAWLGGRILTCFDWLDCT